jgi:hypothetical protein
VSIAAREALCNRLVFQRDSQRSDLMDPNLTQTGLIALLLDVTAGTTWEVTAVRSDHHDDSALGEHTHANGYCLDGWPLNSKTPGDYMNANTLVFDKALRAASGSAWLYQIGLAGSAWSDEAVQNAGPTAFHDDGADHIHLGAV